MFFYCGFSYTEFVNKSFMNNAQTSLVGAASRPGRKLVARRLGRGASNVDGPTGRYVPGMCQICEIDVFYDVLLTSVSIFVKKCATLIKFMIYDL